MVVVADRIYFANLVILIIEILYSMVNTCECESRAHIYPVIEVGRQIDINIVDTAS